MHALRAASQEHEISGTPVLNDEGVLVDMYCDADVLQLPDLDLDLAVGVALEQVDDGDGDGDGAVVEVMVVTMMIMRIVIRTWLACSCAPASKQV